MQNKVPLGVPGGKVKIDLSSPTTKDVNYCNMGVI